MLVSCLEEIKIDYEKLTIKFFKFVAGNNIFKNIEATMCIYYLVS